MSRDIRRFLYFKWRLLDVPARLPVNLGRVWLDRYGFAPPYGAGAVTGFHFAIPDGRGIVYTKPNRLALPSSILNQVSATIAAKHQVCMARLTMDHENPNLKLVERFPQADDEQAVEEWPMPDDRIEPIVIEYATAPGYYLAAGYGSEVVPTFGLTDAQVFESPHDAGEWLDTHQSPAWLVLRTKAAAVAEFDQLEAGLVDGRTG